jgi:DNA-binding LacI/PurR family transcriptional regulator
MRLQTNLAQPFYEQIKTLLRQQVASGLFKADTAVPDEQTLASQLGISRVTVRRALVELTNEGLLKRVRGKGTFVRGSFAPRRRSRVSTLVVLSPFSAAAPLDPFYSRLIVSVQCSAAQHGILISHQQLNLKQPLDAAMAGLRENKNARSVLAIGIDDPKVFTALSMLGVPVVLLDCAQPEPPLFDEVSHSGETGSYQAIASLLEMGHREIAIIQGTRNNSLTGQRQAGYVRALETYGVPVCEDLIFRVPFCPESAYACMNEIFKSGRVPTAVFCTSDDSATAVMFVALEHGLHLPRDLSVIGFGGLRLFSSPRLSTVGIPVEQMGAMAVKLVAERLAEPTAPLRRIALPAEWAPAASCDIPRKRALNVNDMTGARSNG